MSEVKHFTKERIGSGTREWSESSYNVGQGCSHDCLYCYARHSALEFGTILKRSDWPIERLLNRKIKREKRKGVIMFPTQHDVTPFYLPEVMRALDALLNAGNKILLVSKPHPECIEAICKKYLTYKDSILFRFTIGTIIPDISRFWEPGAMLPEDRIEALKIARHYDFDTSVSIEPMLEGSEGAMAVVEAVRPYVTEKVWIGRMNKIDERVHVSSPDIYTAIRTLKMLQSNYNISLLVKELSDPMIEWKESIKRIVK